VSDDEPNKVTRLPYGSRVDHSANTLRDELRRTVDPKEMADLLVQTMRDPAAAPRDRLAALKLIADRRDGLPVATVVTSFASPERAFADLPDSALEALNAIYAKYLSEGSEVEGDGNEDEE